MFIQLLVENLAPTLDMGATWIVAVERTLAGYGLKVIDAATGQDLAQEGSDVHAQST